MANSVGGKVLPKFREVFKLPNKDPLRWFPGHMGKGLKQMQNSLKNIDCVIEVHDSRIPISGRYINFKRTMTSLKPHIYVLNKVDLMDTNYKTKVIDHLKVEGVENVFFTNMRKDNCREVKKIIPLAINLIENSERYNRLQAEDYTLMVIGVPNVGKSSLINRLRNQNLKKRNAAQVGAKAGVTRSLMNRIKVSEKPPMYLLDTPGILDPVVPDVYAGLKLALCGCIQDTVVGAEVMSDYLLFWLNKNQKFDYVDILGLSKPTDNVVELLTVLSVKNNWFMKIKDFNTGMIQERPNFQVAGSHFLNLFRKGEFGQFCLDSDKLD